MKTGVWLQNLYEKEKKSSLLWYGLASASEAEPGDSRSSLANKVSSRPVEDPVPKLRQGGWYLGSTWGCQLPTAFTCTEVCASLYLDLFSSFEGPWCFPSSEA